MQASGTVGEDGIDLVDRASIRAINPNRGEEPEATDYYDERSEC